MTGAQIDPRLPEITRIEGYSFFRQGSTGIGPVKQNTGPHPAVKYFIQFFSFATGRITPFAPLEKEFKPETPAFSISSDDRWILYSQVDQSGSDIMLVENFR